MFRLALCGVLNRTLQRQAQRTLSVLFQPFSLACTLSRTIQALLLIFNWGRHLPWLLALMGLLPPVCVGAAAFRLRGNGAKNRPRKKTRACLLVRMWKLLCLGKSWAFESRGQHGQARGQLCTTPMLRAHRTAQKRLRLIHQAMPLRLSAPLCNQGKTTIWQTTAAWGRFLWLMQAKTLPIVWTELRSTTLLL